VFGSVPKGASRPESDVDLLVEFEPDAKPTLLTMAEIEVELSPLLRGRKVDLRTPRDLSRYFREEVVRTAQAARTGLVTGFRLARRAKPGSLGRNDWHRCCGMTRQRGPGTKAASATALNSSATFDRPPILGGRSSL
jgi:uncharacterized protein